MDQFKGKTAFVTGGASGIGLGLCRAFGRRGMDVVIADVEAAACAQAVETLRSEGIAVIGVTCDVSDRESLAAAAAQAFARNFKAPETRSKWANLATWVRTSNYLND